MGRRKKKIKEWVVEACIESIEAGRSTLETLRAKNPEAAEAVERFQAKLTRERAAIVPYRLGFWDKNGTARVYVNGGRLAAIDCTVWLQADDSVSRTYEVKHRGDWYECGTSFAQCGEKPWEVIVLEAFAELGIDICSTFDDLVNVARR